MVDHRRVEAGVPTAPGIPRPGALRVSARFTILWADEHVERKAGPVNPRLEIRRELEH
jgi:hypothetical protein